MQHKENCSSTITLFATTWWCIQLWVVDNYFHIDPIHFIFHNSQLINSNLWHKSCVPRLPFKKNENEPYFFAKVHIKAIEDLKKKINK